MTGGDLNIGKSFGFEQTGGVFSEARFARYYGRSSSGEKGRAENPQLQHSVDLP